MIGRFRIANPRVTAATFLVHVQHKLRPGLSAFYGFHTSTKNLEIRIMNLLVGLVDRYLSLRDRCIQSLYYFK
jgi:hypothetical protein